jgi:hypothetical protein
MVLYSARVRGVKSTTMRSCYDEEILFFTDPLLKTIPVSYLITMRGSSRRHQYMSELQQYRPTATVVVLHNWGHRRCSKPAWVDTSAKDLWHANQHIAAKEHAEPVLVMEDDVRFAPRIVEWAAEMERFLASGEVEAYNLGAMMIVSYPISDRHVRCISCGNSQAVIYKPPAMQKMRGFSIRYLHDVEFLSHLQTFACVRPLTFQRHDRTENSRVWDPLGVLFEINRMRGFLSDPLLEFECYHDSGMKGGILFTYSISILAIYLALRWFIRYRLRQPRIDHP